MKSPMRWDYGILITTKLLYFDCTILLNLLNLYFHIFSHYCGHIVVYRWETLRFYWGLASTGGAPLACSCPQHWSESWELVLPYVLSHHKAQVRRSYCWYRHSYILFCSLRIIIQLPELVFSFISRKCHCLDITFHLWRLPLHSFGERGAWPAGGVQF